MDISADIKSIFLCASMSCILSRSPGFGFPVGFVVSSSRQRLINAALFPPPGAAPIVDIVPSGKGNDPNKHGVYSRQYSFRACAFMYSSNAIKESECLSLNAPDRTSMYFRISGSMLPVKSSASIFASNHLAASFAVCACHAFMISLS